MYPDIFYVSSESDMGKSNVLNLLSRVESFEYAKNLESCGRSIPDIFKSEDALVPRAARPS